MDITSEDNEIYVILILEAFDNSYLPTKLLFPKRSLRLWNYWKWYIPSEPFSQNRRGKKKKVIIISYSSNEVEHQEKNYIF